MDKLLETSLLWRLCAALWAWLRQSVVGRAFAGLGRLWRESAFYRLAARLLCAPAAVEGSCFRGLLDGWNACLHRLGERIGSAVDHSLIYSTLHRKLHESLLLGRAASLGVTGWILVILAAYAPIDYLLRDVLHWMALASVWDEALMIFALLWIGVQRIRSPKPLRSAANSMDLWVGLYLVVGLLLLLYVHPHPGVNITGFRASMQYLLVFYLVTRLIRSKRDFMRMYDLMVLIAAVIALYGIYQFIIGVEIPATWTDQAEGAVRTRVFGIFSNPNIMAAYMILFAPMAIGRAYTAKTPTRKVFFWFCGICMCLGCLFTMTRGAWLALAVAALLFAVIVDRKLLGILLVCGVAACFLPFVRSRIGYLFTDAFKDSNSRAGRGKRWELALTYVDQYGAWAQGLGYGMYGGAVAAQNHVNPEFTYMYVDNYYVKILAENGILGLSTFLAMLAGLLWNGARACARSFRGGRKPLCAGMLTGLIAILIHSFFECIWEEPYMMSLFFVVAGMLVYAGFLWQEDE